MDTEDDKWAGFCAVECTPNPACVVDEDVARTWICDLSNDQSEANLEENLPNDGELDPANVAAARAEEVSYMQVRGL